MSRPALPKFSRHFHISLIGIVVVLLISYVAILNWRVNRLEDQAYCTKVNSLSCPGSFPVRSLIQDALRSLYSNYGAIDATTNRVYFPELKIYLPLSQDARNLRYTFTAADPNYQPADEAVFNTVPYINRLPASFDDVPCLQRLATVSVNKPSKTDETKSGNLTLSDGRTLYFYKNTSPQCKNFWPDNAPTRIVELLKTAKSY